MRHGTIIAPSCYKVEWCTGLGGNSLLQFTPGAVSESVDDTHLKCVGLCPCGFDPRSRHPHPPHFILCVSLRIHKGTSRCLEASQCLITPATINALVAMYEKTITVLIEAIISASFSFFPVFSPKAFAHNRQLTCLPVRESRTLARVNTAATHQPSLNAMHCHP